MPNGRLFELQHVVLAPHLRVAEAVVAPPATPDAATVASTATISAVALHAQPLSIQPARAELLRIRPKLELMRPDLFQVATSFPRESSSHPIAATAQPDDTQLFESADGATRYWLPRYRLRAATQGRYQVGVVADADGRWVLSLGLERYPAPEIATAAQTAARLPHTIAATLRFMLPGTTVERRLAVDEIVEDAGGPVAILRLPLADRDDVLGAFMTRESKTTLDVARQYTVAVPTGEEAPADATPVDPGASIPVDPIEPDRPFPRLRKPIPRGRVTPVDPRPVSPLAEGVLSEGRLAEGRLANAVPADGALAATRMRRLDIASIRATPTLHARPLIRERPRIEVPPAVTAKPLYRQAPQHQPIAIPLWFDRNLHPYIYPSGAPDAAAGSALTLHTVAWTAPGQAARNHAYFQSVSDPSRFWYLPDVFRLARTGTAPFRPALAFVVDQGESEDATEVELIADVQPVTDGKRLLAARTALAAKIPATGVAPRPITLEPLLARSVLRLGLPRGGRMQQVTLDIPVDLANGFQLSDRFAMDAFQDVFAALTSEQPGTLLRGTVAVSTGMGGDALIPVEIDVCRMQGELFEYVETPDPATGGMSVRLRNLTEGALSISALPAWLARGATMLPASVRGIDLSQPLRLDADGELLIEVLPDAPWPDDAQGPIDAIFDTSAIVALPDPEQVFAQTFDNSIEQDTLREITVMTDPSVLAGDGTPGSALRMIIIEFAGNRSVRLSATQIEQTVQVPVPLMDILLRRDTEGRYRFRQTLIPVSGPQRTDPQWRESDLAVLFAPIS